MINPYPTKNEAIQEVVKHVSKQHRIPILTNVKEQVDGVVNIDSLVNMVNKIRDDRGISEVFIVSTATDFDAICSAGEANGWNDFVKYVM